MRDYSKDARKPSKTDRDTGKTVSFFVRYRKDASSLPIKRDTMSVSRGVGVYDAGMAAGEITND